MAELNYIIKPTTQVDHRQMGGKASSLAKLNTNFTIPNWFVISPQAFMDSLSEQQLRQLELGESITGLQISDSVQSAINKAVTELTDDTNLLLAVRSSATAEDGEYASFAGQLESYLNISSKDIANKVLAVWQSAFSQQVTYYRKTFANQSEWIPAVIIQHMVDAEIAGVAFSADPVSGNPNQCVINAVHGLADKLVSGEVNGDTYYTDNKGTIKKQTLCTDKAILSKPQIEQIINLLSRVEDYFQIPQDIEWAFAKGILYLLQARPITNLKYLALSGKQITRWDNSNIVESYAGITSPLTFSFARYVYEHVYIKFCKLMKVSSTKVEQHHSTFRNMLGFINGHVYYNLLNWYRMLALFPGFQMNRHFMEQMMGVKEPLPDIILQTIISSNPSTWDKVKDSFSLIRTLYGLIWQQIVLKNTIKRFYKRLDKALSTSQSLDKLSLSELGNEYRTLEGSLLKKWDAPLINDFLCMIAFGVSRKLLEKEAGTKGLQLHNDIMIGQGDIISAEPAARIKKMAAIINNDPSMIAHLINGDITAIDNYPELKQAINAYLDKFGDRCLQELKLESPTLHDDPTSLLQAIGYMAQRQIQTEETSENSVTIDTDAELAELFPNRLKRWLVGSAIKWAKSRVRDRENLRFERTRVFGRVRQIFIHIGKHLQELGYINAARDIFYLEVNEILGLIEGTTTTSNLKKLIKNRHKQQQIFTSLSPPPNQFDTFGAAYVAFQTQAFHSQPPPLSADSNSTSGIGCCQGIVIAKVKVIRNPRQAELKNGEIMVAEFTDPGWITLFANASGILVERGSLLSHSAIVAREMGIPAIVAIDGVMDWLKDGDVVEMNGSTGVVRKITNEKKANDQ